MDTPVVDALQTRDRKYRRSRIVSLSQSTQRRQIQLVGDDMNKFRW